MAAIETKNSVESAKGVRKTKSPEASHEKSYEEAGLQSPDAPYNSFEKPVNAQAGTAEAMRKETA